MLLHTMPQEPGKNQILEGLLAVMASGDIGALEKLYHHTKTDVYGFALSIVKNPQSAEDIMQEAYIKLYTSAAQYRAQGKPMAWILTIVRNLSLMKLRERSNRELPLEEAWEVPAQSDCARRLTDRMLLQATLETLADTERQIVVLHGVSGLKHREIAGILNIPLSTVLSKYRRALSKLKKQMKEEAP